MLRGNLHIHCAMYVQVSMSCTYMKFAKKKYRYHASFVCVRFSKGGGGGRGWETRLVFVSKIYRYLRMTPKLVDIIPKNIYYRCIKIKSYIKVGYFKEHFVATQSFIFQTWLEKCNSGELKMRDWWRRS